MKQKTLGYRVLTKNWEIVDELVGTQPRKELDKYRAKGYIVKKLSLPKVENF